MRALLRKALVIGILALGVMTPRSASAVTLDQVLALAKAGVTDVVILALIDRDRTIFAIEPEQLVTLQREGLSEKVILAMLKSGREEGEQSAAAVAAFNSAWMTSAMLSDPGRYEPERSVVVGHGLDNPNAPPYTAPPFRYRTPSLGARRTVEPRALCYAQISTPRSGPSQPFVTECPAVMQPRRR